MKHNYNYIYPMHKRARQTALRCFVVLPSNPTKFGVAANCAIGCAKFFKGREKTNSKTTVNQNLQVCCSTAFDSIGIVKAEKS